MGGRAGSTWRSGVAALVEWVVRQGFQMWYHPENRVRWADTKQYWRKPRGTLLDGLVSVQLQTFPRIHPARNGSEIR